MSISINSADLQKFHWMFSCMILKCGSFYIFYAVCYSYPRVRFGDYMVKMKNWKSLTDDERSLNEMLSTHFQQKHDIGDEFVQVINCALWCALQLVHNPIKVSLYQ